MDLTKFVGYPVVKKLWGREIWLANVQYCAKLLVVEPGFACSLHRHPGLPDGTEGKDEQFTVLQGVVAIEWGTDPSFLHIETKAVGDSLRMMPNTWHRFWSSNGEQVVLLEVSSHHADDDVERLQESRAL